MTELFKLKSVFGAFKCIKLSDLPAQLFSFKSSTRTNVDRSSMQKIGENKKKEKRRKNGGRCQKKPGVFKIPNNMH